MTPARAQDAQTPDARTQATGRALFNEGVALYNDGKFAEACAKLETSLKYFPGIGVRGKLAECYEKLGRYASAWSMYKEVADLATRSGEPTREAVANERVKALDPKLSHVTIVLPPANDVPGLVVKRNGQVLERAKLGAAQTVDAGNVTVEVTAPNRKLFYTQVAVTVGQSTRIEIPALEPIVIAETPAPEPPPPHASTPLTEPPAPPTSTPWQKPAGLVIGGLGITSMLVGGVFGFSARATYDSAFDNGACTKPTNECTADGQSQIDSARSQATASTILFITGGALTAGGIVLYLTAPRARTSGLRLVPSPYAGGAGLTLAGSL
ncbi:hypothetical protein AKJ09_08834 [Labilithrix luteola]|uniref:Tetratricopeptide repeat protein n=1 Tax=Labilithrix luteola TaxID=1391654 RepID=A0A0K1Q8N7_9BACT|nr:tetratricopeptide repeat protein [Labilithrix luteola]AKV02171.1 hypothetical protein AKJ09_08834 [Labilithrix luteola]